jgi:hypothetical protein
MHVRTLAVMLAFGSAASSVANLQCADDDKSLGASCLKDGDCASGFCSGQVCVAAPATFDSEPPVTDAAADAQPMDAPAREASRADARPEASEAESDVKGSEPEEAGDAEVTDTSPSKDGAKGGG